jgi:redox-sensitive bicupin YhaK (pirin superfamily)
MDVPPHPHIGLQTVSWLLEGEVLHHDSLGLTGLARPGVVNLMTAGGGIAHSEETPPEHSGRLGGVQLWTALPEAERHRPPSFEQHGELPTFSLEGGAATIFLGSLAGVTAPGTTFSPLVGVDLAATTDAPLALPLDPAFEHAIVPLSGNWTLDDRMLSPATLYYLGCGRDALTVSCPSAPDGPARALLLGGTPFGESVLMWWNFVARTSDEIVAAREDWEAGRRFGEVRAYDGARLEAPPFVARPVA